ncbi:MAG: GTP-binding protein [Candidatus Heimdallarchaeota archaeon]|nr:MAG: GTP-binding protein [Candidatus Heimdallarchaeota archaeon]
MTYPIGYRESYFKICIIGDGGVGKTSLRERLLGEDFESTYLLTIGADFATYETEIENQQFKFQIWDLAGQQRFNVVRSIYYRGSHGAILVFDQSRPESFSNLEEWKNEMYTHVGRKIPFIVLGNKSDLKNRIDQVALQEFIEKSENEFSFLNVPFTIPYLNTSARTSYNVEEAFTALAHTIRDFILATENRVI